MKEIEFDFKNKEYLFFIRLEDKQAGIGVIELDKIPLVNISEYDKEKCLKNIFGLDYEVLEKLEQKVNPKLLVKVVNHINKSIYFHCDTEMSKNLLEENLKKIQYDINIIWKIKL